MRAKKFWIVLAIVAVVSLIVWLIVWQNKRDDRPFNQYDFPETINITNTTDHDRADTMCMVLANKILDLDTLNMIIVYIPEVINEGEMEFFGIVQHIPFKTNQFVLLLNPKMSMSSLMETLSHEFVHIGQYIYGDLEVYPKYAKYAGDSIVFADVMYHNRTFEIEAFSQQSRINKELKRLLWN